MIRFVRGQLAAMDDEGAVVCMGGVGLHLRVSMTTRGLLPAVGTEVLLQTYLVVREDALDLYGFGDGDERRLFEALIGVNGVGPRVALALCGLGTPAMLAMAIRNGEVARLTKASGVGRRTAERVVLELREKMGSAGMPVPGMPAGTGGGEHGTARDGLLALGFRPDEVDSALASAADGLDAEALVRHGLAALGRT